MPAHSFLRRTVFLSSVALATALAAPSAQAQHASHAAPAKNIVEVAVGAGSFKTLVAAVQAAGLVETLSGKGPFTVFAPSDAAFAKLPQGTIEALLKDKAKLTEILTLHVVPGRIMAADVVAAKRATPKTVNGRMLDVVLRDGKVFANGAQVVTADVGATNGVIHVIDTVILPGAAGGAGY